MTVFLPAPRHHVYPDGAWTSCGLKGVQHRVLALTNDPKKTSCRNCLRSLRKAAKR